MWKAGQSGNPSGRCKKDNEFFEELRKRLTQALAVLDKKLMSGNLDAAKWTTEMILGKPTQQVQNTGEMNLNINIVGTKKGLLHGYQH